MTQSSQYRAYKKASHTVAKTRQIVMLYDGAIRFLQQAKEAIEAKRYEERFHLLTKVSAIMTGLQSSLDFEGQPEMAQSLFDFYNDLELKIATLHRSNDLASCHELIEEIRQMRNMWDEIDREGSVAAPTPINDTQAEASTQEILPDTVTPEVVPHPAPAETLTPLSGILVSA